MRRKLLIRDMTKMKSGQARYRLTLFYRAKVVKKFASCTLFVYL